MHIYMYMLHVYTTYINQHSSIPIRHYASIKFLCNLLEYYFFALKHTHYTIHIVINENRNITYYIKSTF